MTIKTLSEDIYWAEEILSAAMKYIASDRSCIINLNDLIKTRKLFRSLVRDKALLREACFKAQNHIIVIEESNDEHCQQCRKAFEVLQESLTLTDPNQPYRW